MNTEHTLHTVRRFGLKIPSSWIKSIYYKNIGGTGYLAVFTSRGDALLHSGIPSYLPGLVQAGKGGRSVGSAYNKLVRSKGYPYQHVTDPQAVRELKEMMK